MSKRTPKSQPEQPVMAEVAQKEGLPLWKKFVIATLIVAAVYALAAAFQTATAEEVAPGAPTIVQEEPEKESSANFLQRWVAQKVAETDEALAARVQAVEDREAAVKEAEKATALQLSSANIARQKVMTTATELSTCSSAALKEVASYVAETPEG